MTESKSHKALANKLAKKYRTEYNQGAGADIQASNIAIEVETEDTVKDASRQLQGHKKRVYVACTNKKALEQAIDHYAGTTIGVMDNNMKIRKRSTRNKK